MKTIKYSIAVFLMVGLAACIVDLEEYNPSGDTADNVFTTEQGHTGLVNLCYSQLRREFYGRPNPIGICEAGTDTWTENPQRLGHFATSTYSAKLDPLEGSLMKPCWERLYIPINNCNVAIKRGPSAMYRNSALRDQRVAEAKFLRAYYYWHIVEQWGGVVLKEDETDRDVNSARRSSVRDFYEKLILPDLEAAAATLPNRQADHGRATKAAAQGLLARMYLTWASYLKYFENNDAEAQTYYQKALAAADLVINSPEDYKEGLKLYSDIHEVFAQGNNKTNAEAMFVVSHSTVDPVLSLNRQDNPNRLPSSYVVNYAAGGMGVQQSRHYGYASEVYLVPTKYLLDLYDASKDARYNAFFREVWRCNDPRVKSDLLYMYWTPTAITLFEKDETKFRSIDPDFPPTFATQLGFNVGDTAVYFTKNAVPNKATVKYAVRDVDDIYQSNGVVKTSNTFFPQLIKFQDSVYSVSTSRNNSGRLDVIVMRLAEMYLIAAEAQFHISNNDADPIALGYVNALRKRAAIPTGSTNNDATAADVAAAYWNKGGHLNFILDERAREFCGEHLRWFDLKRTKQLEHRLGEGRANPNITEFRADKHYVRPIPVTFLNSIENRGEFGQNPGY